MNKYYPKYYSARASGIVEVTDEYKGEMYKIFRDRARPISAFKKDGRILDVGCGDGYFLKYMKDNGWETYGVEPGEVASKYAKDVLKVNVFNGELKEASYPNKYFDVITLFEVLEHLHDPSANLSEIGRVLKEDGLLITTVPNFAGFSYKIFKERRVAIDAPRHLYHFSQKTLGKILEKMEFKVLKIKHVSNTMDYSDSLRYLLMDYKLYPHKKYQIKKIEEKRLFEAKEERKILKETFLLMERSFFSGIGFLADRLNQGSTLVASASKVRRILEK
jgi:2-polyprenyl-3-methyl-5-hydroxy-6-metoxy-1,4-benzoquinol methylase